MAQGLIFDCDGVLVDSEPLAVEELEALFRAHDLPIDRARIYDAFLGRSLSHIVAVAARDYGIDLGPALPGFSQRLAGRFRTDLRAVPGMAAAIAQLPGRRAVASSSAPERLSLSLSLTGIAPLFGAHVYSATQVARGKPAPDLFLLAAERMGMAAPDCIVIEDSPAGLRAARAAGMRVVGFLGGAHAGAACLRAKLGAENPDALIDHADDLPKTLAMLG